ncbi:hypothetical protein Bca52824_065175 [Brassica carinata]|uniref:Uncharacterized protein n=1 Tax=Brassica carinata TaxID=52824 RepID=A0A8X7QHY2_BRACI|nr:hypothetical protein Bca52824_065175 [Brassica carinata]
MLRTAGKASSPFISDVSDLRPIPDFGDDGSNGLGDNIHRATSLTSTLSLGHAHNANEPYVDPVAIHPLRLLPPSSNASKKAHRG